MVHLKRVIEGKTAPDYKKPQNEWNQETVPILFDNFV